MCFFCIYFAEYFHVYVYFSDVIVNIVYMCMCVYVYVIVFKVDLEEASNKPVPRKPLVFFVPRGSYTRD